MPPSFMDSNYQQSPQQPFPTAAPSSGNAANGNDSWPDYSPLDVLFLSYQSVHGYLVIGACIVSMTCNLCNVIVLTRRNMASTINFILVAIAVLDTIAMLSCFIYVLRFQLLGYQVCQLLTFEWSSFVLVHVNTVVTIRSMVLWLSVAMAAVRDQVVRSHIPRTDLTANRRVALMIIVGTVFIVLLVNIPIISTFAVEEYDARVLSSSNTADSYTTNGSSLLSPGCPSTIYVVGASDFASSIAEGLPLKIGFWLNGICNKVIPMILLGFFAVSIVVRIRRNAYSRRVFRRALMRHGSGSSIHPTAPILATILVTTMAVEVPHAVLSFLAGMWPEFYVEVYKNVGDMFDLFSIINSSTTFVLYCAMSRAFRVTFKRVLCSCWYTPPSTPASQRTSQRTSQRI